MFFERIRVKGRIIRCIALIGALAAFCGSVHAQEVKKSAENVRSDLAVLASHHPSDKDFDAFAKKKVKPLIDTMVKVVSKNADADSAKAAAGNIEELSKKTGLVEYIKSIKKVEDAIEDYTFKVEILDNKTYFISHISSKLDNWNDDPIHVRFEGSKSRKSVRFVLSADEVGKVLKEKSGSPRNTQAYWLWKIIQQKYNIKV